MNININNDYIGSFKGIRVEIDIKIKTALENVLNGLGILTSSEFLFLTIKVFKDTINDILTSLKNIKCEVGIVEYIEELFNYISINEHKGCDDPISYIWFDVCYDTL